jgi:hypothetical protein
LTLAKGKTMLGRRLLLGLVAWIGLDFLLGYRLALILNNLLEDGYGSNLPFPLQVIPLFLLFSLVFILSLPTMLFLAIGRSLGLAKLREAQLSSR